MHGSYYPPVSFLALTLVALAGCGREVPAPMELAYLSDGGLAVIEGDIILDTEEGMQRRLQSARSGFALPVAVSWGRWSQARVPYVIDKNLPNPSRVLGAIQHYHDRTKLRFIPRTTQAAYILFRPWAGGYCRSWIGRTGKAQAIDLEGYCDQRSVIHEIGHAVGLWHEHTRGDRDKFVKIVPQNIIAGLGINFAKRVDYAEKIGAYDFASVMHYRASELSRNGLPTVTRLDGSTEGLSNPDGLSAGDIATLKKMYP